MIKKLVAGLSVWVTASSGLLLGKAGSSNDLVFGNYSDYISPDVAQELREKYRLRVDLFDYDHLVKERFQKGIYDIAVVSTSVLSELKSSGAAMKLDWGKLLDDKPNNSESGSNLVSGQNSSKTSKEAAELFTDIVKEMSKDLLDYGIPYFVQKLSFYYTGRKIDSLEKDKPIKFKDLIQKISADDRFKSKDGKPKLGLIDDPRTVLSFARKVAGKSDVNPTKEEYKNSESILSDYKELIKAGLDKNKLGENFLYMTPDSGPMVDALSGGDINGAFMYNGDGYFASEGGNAEKTMKKDQFHTVELAENIFFLDFITFSNNMPKHKIDKAYSMAKDLLFISKANENEPFKKKPKSEDSEESYVEMAIRNFDDVGYTPTLKSVYDKLEDYFKDDDSESSDENDSDDGDGESDAEGQEDEVEDKLKIEILKVEKTNGVKLEQEYERQLDSQQKSDMLIAYSNFKLLV